MFDYEKTDLFLLRAEEISNTKTTDDAFEIITKVYLRESIPALARAVSITLISLLGLTTMGGAVGGGGIGDMVITYGNNRNMYDITLAAIPVILIIVLVIEIISKYVIKKTTH